MFYFFQRNWFGFALMMVLLVSTANAGSAQTFNRKGDGRLLLENFQNDSVGTYPKGWYDRNGDKKLRNHSTDYLQNYDYSIQQQGNNKYLHYKGIDAKHLNLPLINKDKDNIYNININQTPVLSWKWKAIQLPENANEDDDDRNDAVASVYVVWGFGHVLFKKVPKTVRYTWSTTLPRGKELSKFFGNQKIVVLQSGREKAGRWITENRNIAKDYKDLFGDNPPKAPLAILILSDGDSTNSMVEAAYDDFILKVGKQEDLNAHQ